MSFIHFINAFGTHHHPTGQNQNGYQCPNVSPCQIYIIFGPKHKLNLLNKVIIKEKINNSDLKRVTEIKYFGVFLDENLSFKSHINYIIKNVSKI